MQHTLRGMMKLWSSKICMWQQLISVHQASLCLCPLDCEGIAGVMRGGTKSGQVLGCPVY